MNDIPLNNIIDLLCSTDLETVKLGASFAKDYPYICKVDYLKYKADKVLNANTWSTDLLNHLTALKWEILAYKSIDQYENIHKTY